MRPWKLPSDLGSDDAWFGGVIRWAITELDACPMEAEAA
jgi:hypothetical protein